MRHSELTRNPTKKIHNEEGHILHNSSLPAMAALQTCSEPIRQTPPLPRIPIHVEDTIQPRRREHREHLPTKQRFTHHIIWKLVITELL
jgi:hypothetical protein